METCFFTVVTLEVSSFTTSSTTQVFSLKLYIPQVSTYHTTVITTSINVTNK